MVQPSLGLGDTCVVEWASGRQAEYDTGRGSRFQLVHLEMSCTSGAPVARGIKAEERQGEPGSQQDWELHGWELAALQRALENVEFGTVVERGTHWINLPEGYWWGSVYPPNDSSCQGKYWKRCSCGQTVR